MESNSEYFWNRVGCDWSPYVYLEHVASHIYGDFCAGDLAFEEMMESCYAIHRLEGLLIEEEEKEEILYRVDLREDWSGQ